MCRNAAIARGWWSGVTLIAVLSAGCAARSAAGPDAGVLARASDLVQQGCYECLLEARTLHAAVQQPRLNDSLHLQQFELELLIALREKELAMDARATLARARARAAAVPAAIDASRYLDIVQTLPSDARGTPAGDRQPALSARSPWVRETLDWLADRDEPPLLAGYLRTTLECIGAGAPAAGEPFDETSRDEPPLLAYRRAVCGSRIDADALAQVERDVPRFVEASLFLARSGLGTAGSREGAGVRARLTDALARLPESPAIAYELGAIMTVFRDHRAAADYYSAVLTLREHHHDARLRRAVAYSYMRRHAEAIAELTRLLDAPAPVRADAFYWRAWNRHVTGELDLARADSDASKSLRWDSQILALAGIIEHDQRDFDVAREDLTLASRLNPADCAVLWYLALVELAGDNWMETARHFGRAADCYAESAADNARERDLMARRDDLEPEFRAAQIAGFDAAIAEDRSQESAAAINAAVNHARSGARAEAVQFLERAERDPARREMGEALRKVLAPVE